MPPQSFTCLNNVNDNNRQAIDNNENCNNDLTMMISTVCKPNSISMNSLVNVEEPKELKIKTEWHSIYLCTAITFISSVQYTLYSNSLWAFMKSMDSGVSEFQLGLINAAYNVAYIIGGPLFGYWSNRMGSIKMALTTCLAITLLGNLMYALVEVFPINPVHSLMIARFIMGLGSSTQGLTKSYTASASLSKDRPRAIAFITGGMAIGIIIGPGIQLIFTKIKDINWLGNFVFHKYNMPAFFCCCISLMSLALTELFFVESFVGIRKTKKQVKESDNTYIKLISYDRFAVAVCHALRFTQLFVNCNFETIGVSFAMIMFAWTAEEALQYISVMSIVQGVLALLTYVSYISFDLGKRTNERLACFVSLIAFLILYLTTYSWPVLPNDVQKYSSIDYKNKSDLQSAVGCNVNAYTWCDSMKRVNVYVFYIITVPIIGIFFSHINITLNTLFSRIIGPRLQSTQQGFLQVTGGMARVIGSTMIGHVFKANGPRAVWIIEVVVILGMMFLWLISYSRLVPLKLNESSSAIPSTHSSKTNSVHTVSSTVDQSGLRT